MEELSIPAIRENLPQALDFVGRNLDALGCDATVRMQLDIAVEEIFINISSYAYSPGTGPVTIRFEAGESPKSAILRFLDGGAPYDPLAKEDPDIHQPLMERRQGGLGIFMVKQYMDGMEYAYRDGQNILTLIKNL